MNYWKTSQSSADTWIERTKADITEVGGTIVNEAYGRDQTGCAALLLEFAVEADRFRVVWPVLPTQTTKPADERAARVQAATMLYHDVKAKRVSAKVHGVRASFFQYLALKDGRTAAQLAIPELVAHYNCSNKHTPYPQSYPISTTVRRVIYDPAHGDA